MCLTFFCFWCLLYKSTISTSNSNTIGTAIYAEIFEAKKEKQEISMEKSTNNRPGFIISSDLGQIHTLLILSCACMFEHNTLITHFKSNSMTSYYFIMCIKFV